MNLTRKLYSNCEPFSPVLKDFRRVSKLNKDGSKSVLYVENDCSKIIEQNGTVDLWSLSSMLKAGITPSEIHTTPSQRLANEEKVLDMDNQVAEFVENLQNQEPESVSE